MTDRFAQRLRRLNGVIATPGFGHGWISSYGTIELDPAHDADEAVAVLAGHGVETREWWGKGCHTHAAYRDCPRDDLPVTEDLAQRVLGLPFWLGLDDPNLDYVFDRLAEALSAKAA
jgi:dTDP-4-amino-4,6-dideoxygalactose transaminase